MQGSGDFINKKIYYQEYLTHIQFLFFLGWCINSSQVADTCPWVLFVHWRMGLGHQLFRNSFLIHFFNVICGFKGGDIKTSNFIYIFHHKLWAHFKALKKAEILARLADYTGYVFPPVGWSLNAIRNQLVIPISHVTVEPLAISCHSGHYCSS